MKNINKVFGGLVLLILVLGVLVYSNSKSSERIKVGVLLPLSSDFAWWGDTIRDSIQLAQASGYAKDFEFIYQDTKCNTKDAVSATQSLKSLHPSMHLFIVGCDNDLKAMFPLLDKDQDLSFMVGLSGADLYSDGFPVINLAHRLEDEAAAAAKFSVDHLAVKKAGIITDNGTFGATLAQSFSKYLTEVGGSSIAEKVKYNETSPDTSILKILQSKPEVIYLQNDIPGLSVILKRLTQLNYQGARIVYYGGHDQSLIDSAGLAAEGLYVPWVISQESNPLRDNFVKAFQTKYQREPFVTAYFVYDGLILLDEANKHCQDDVRCIEQYFYNKEDFVGTLGQVEYQPNGQVQRNFYFQQVRDGKFVEVIK